VAAGFAQADIAAALLDAGADVDVCDVLCGETALMVAADHGHELMVSTLLRAGAEMDTVNTAGNTAMHLAAHAGWVQVLHVLIEAGAAVRVTNWRSETPADVAAKQGHLVAVAMLMERM